MFFGCCIVHPTVMARRRVWRDFLYDVGEQCRHAEDYALWLRLVTARRFKLANITEPLLRLRRHANNVSRTHADAQRRASLALVAAALVSCVPSPLDAPLRLAALLASPESAASFDDVVSVARCIDALAAAIVVRIATTQSRAMIDATRSAIR